MRLLLEILLTWISHRPENFNGWFYLGRTTSTDILHIDFEDVGCNSHWGVPFTIVARWNTAPVAVSLGDATDSSTISYRFQWYWRKESTTVYHLAMRMIGWDTYCSGNTAGTSHQLSYWVSSSSGAFRSRSAYTEAVIAAETEDRYTSIEVCLLGLIAAVTKLFFIQCVCGSSACRRTWTWHSAPRSWPSALVLVGFLWVAFPPIHVLTAPVCHFPCSSSNASMGTSYHWLD